MIASELLDDTSTKSHTYRFAKKHGILISHVHADYAEVIIRPDCTPHAIFEVRRYLDIPLHLTEVDIEHFTLLLTKNYETKALAAQQIAEDMGEDLDLQQLMTNLPNASDLLETESDAPVIRLINALMREAIKQNASDIHFETFEKVFLVRFRVDGILHNVLELPNHLAPLIVSRLKVLSKLDISEKRLPQDGRIGVHIAGRSIDMRVSTIPVNHGERVVLRLLDKKAIALKLSDLGMSENLLKLVTNMISKPHGIILVTGPTGAGKTTSLYAMLTELNVPGRNIMTVEDPIEYDLVGIGQIQVNPKIEMTFARSLRAILRQDPNIVMIGEIRDYETAEIAIQASLTGHLVLSTLHTNTAIGAIARLRDMGVESFLLASSLLGVIAQRLLRKLCLHCKEAYSPTIQESETLGIDPTANKLIYRAKGCPQCNKTGYSGRIGVYEVVEIDFTIRTMIHENKNEQELESYARTLTTSIWQNSILQVLSGQTTIEEIIRVTNEL